MSNSNTSAASSALEKLCAVPSRHLSPVCRAQKLLALRFRRPDPQQAAKFFIDFGLTVVTQERDLVLLRGAADESACMILERGPAAFVGLCFELANEDDLNRLALAHNATITDADHGRGGRCVVLHDPDGIKVEAIWNFNRLAISSVPTPFLENHVGHTPRLNVPVRLALDQPGAINKIGHTVLGVRRGAESIAWYQKNFGLIVSDFQLLEGDATPVVAFMRCDLGDKPADHHTLGIAAAVHTGHAHSAFEMNGLDAVAAAGEYLRRRAHHHIWGIGRHTHGSQLFDYWSDPHGDIFEHYSDGDLFDDKVPTGYHPIHKESMHQWGPPMSSDMVGKRPSMKLLRTVASRVLSDDDLSLRRLAKLITAT